MEESVDRAAKLRTLTTRQIEILALVCCGKSYAEIGDTLYITERSVQWHMSNVYQRLGIDTLAPAARRFELSKLCHATQHMIAGGAVDPPKDTIEDAASTEDERSIGTGGDGPPRLPSDRHGRIPFWLPLAAILLVFGIWGVASAVRMPGRSAATPIPAGAVGGLWVSPGHGFVVQGDVLHFSARAYSSNPADQSVGYVNFTAYWPSGGWSLACTSFSPSAGTADTYECDWLVPAVDPPNGPIAVSFDVYDQGRHLNKAPHGLRQGTVQR